MFCKYCGSKLPDNASFCVTCGKKVATEDYASGADAFTYADPNNFEFYDHFTNTPPTPPTQKDEERDAHGGKILCFAILALAFSLSFYLAFVGTVFFILAKVQLGKYLAKYGETEGRASVGKALSIAALPVNIVMMALLSLIMLVLLLA